MCTGVSIEQWRVAVGVMAAMAPNCKRRCKKSKATGKSIASTKCLALLVLLLLLISNHIDYGLEKNGYESLKHVLPPLVGVLVDTNPIRTEHRIQIPSELLVSVSGLLLVMSFLMVLVQKLLLMCGDVEPNPGPTPLTINDLEVIMKELISVQDKWLKIGNALHFREEKLQDISRTCLTSNECLRSILRQWLQVQSPIPTWEAFVDILSVIGEEELFKRMRDTVPGKKIYYVCPGAKVRMITREARYYTKTRAFASFYAIISRAHAVRAVT